MKEANGCVQRVSSGSEHRVRNRLSGVTGALCRRDVHDVRSVSEVLSGVSAMLFASS